MCTPGGFLSSSIPSITITAKAARLSILSITSCGFGGEHINGTYLPLYMISSKKGNGELPFTELGARSLIRFSCLLFLQRDCFSIPLVQLLGFLDGHFLLSRR